LGTISMATKSVPPEQASRFEPLLLVTCLVLLGLSAFATFAALVF